jgi:aspartate/methionine/tyrosine aminotransferase
MKPANRLNQVREYYFSKKLTEIKKLKNDGVDIINLGIGSPDLPPHPDVIKELSKTMYHPDSNMYQSYRGISELRSAIDNWYKQMYSVNLNPETEILPLIGSKEGIMHISMAFCNPGDRVLIPDPGYPTYTSVSNLLNLDIQYYQLKEENNQLPDFDELEILCNDRCKMMWINYPHMPTGKIADKTTLKKLVMWAKYRNILLINDNPYGMILNEHPMSILSFFRDYDNLIELNSLSKSHNMAGWRLGMLAGSEENINHIVKVKSNFDSGMFKPVQLAAVKALGLGNNWYDQLNKEYKKRREIVWKMLDYLDCRYSNDSAGLFVWAKIPKSFTNSIEFADYLLYSIGIFVAPGHIFGNNGKDYIRFSLCANQHQLNDAFKRVKTLKHNLVCE